MYVDKIFEQKSTQNSKTLIRIISISVKKNIKGGRSLYTNTIPYYAIYMGRHMYYICTLIKFLNKNQLFSDKVQNLKKIN